MTMEERKEIFSKEYLSITDMQKLYDVNYCMASTMILNIKNVLTIGRGQTLRLKIQGKLHIQDYLDYIGVTADRYSIVTTTEKCDLKE